jgi:hypothetical protein
MEIEVKVSFKNRTLAKKATINYESIPEQELDNVLTHVFKLIKNEIIQLAEEQC